MISSTEDILGMEFGLGAILTPGKFYQQDAKGEFVEYVPPKPVVQTQAQAQQPQGYRADSYDARQQAPGVNLMRVGNVGLPSLTPPGGSGTGMMMPVGRVGLPSLTPSSEKRDAGVLSDPASYANLSPMRVDGSSFSHSPEKSAQIRAEFATALANLNQRQLLSDRAGAAEQIKAKENMMRYGSSEFDQVQMDVNQNLLEAAKEKLQMIDAELQRRGDLNISGLGDEGVASKLIQLATSPNVLLCAALFGVFYLMGRSEQKSQ